MALKKEKTRRGMTLIELILAASLVAVCSIPIYFLFTSAKRMNVSSKERLEAMAYANTYLSAILSLGEDQMQILEERRDQEHSPPFTPQSLGIPKTPERIHRSLQIQKWSPADSESFFKVSIQIRWEQGTGGRELRYALLALKSMD